MCRLQVDIVEVTTKTALIRSRIPGVEHVINPYTGCGHGCRYCYAVFMGKYSKQHQHAPWGSFVEAKINIVDVLQSELARKRKTGTASCGDTVQDRRECNLHKWGFADT